MTLTATDSLFSSEFMLQMLLKVVTMLPLGNEQSAAVLDLIQVLI